LIDEFRTAVESMRESLKNTVARNPQAAFTTLNQIAYSISVKYGVQLQLHFPDSGKIKDVESYGTENIGIVVDKFRKRFPIPRDAIKAKAKETLGEVETKDAYMYEGKEGLKVFLKGGRLDILPGSIHIWCKVDDNVGRFVDWLMDECYRVRV
jgi:hypothetical protein